MYCGDETGAYIGDVGASASRFGYGGEDNPKYVVPSYVATRRNKEEKNSTLYVPSSCYHYHEDLKPIFRMTTSSSPIVDPMEFVQQGDRIENWDAMETVWKSSMDTLRVWDRYKHTKGGGSAHSTNAQSTSSSTTIRESGEREAAGEEPYNNGTVPHPILAVRPGYTHIIDTKNTNTNPDAASLNQARERNDVERRRELEKYTELLIETLGADACFVAPAPMLAAFSHGRQTCLVVDMGAGGCRVTPVVDGYLLEQSQRRNGRGTDYLYNVTWRAILEQLEKEDNNKKQSASSTEDGGKSKSYKILPRYQLNQQKKKQQQQQKKKNDKTKSSSSTNNPYLTQWAMRDLMYEFHSSLLSSTPSSVVLKPWNTEERGGEEYRVPFIYPSSTKDVDGDTVMKDNSEKPFDEEGDAPTSSSDNDETKTEASSNSEYILPDGTKVHLKSDMGKDMNRVQELFFTDDLPFITVEQQQQSSSLSNQHPTISNLPLHKLIKSSLTAVGDADLRKELCSNVVLVGGASNQIEQRLSYELSNSLTMKTKVLGSKFSVERNHAAWIGGSILTSLGSFQQLWLSKKEYEEYGASLAVQRFP